MTLVVQENKEDEAIQGPQAGGDRTVGAPASSSNRTAESAAFQEASSPDVTREATYVAGQPSQYQGLVTAQAKALGRGRLR